MMPKIVSRSKAKNMEILCSNMVFPSTLLNQVVTSACSSAGLLVVQNLATYVVTTQHSDFCPRVSKPLAHLAIVALTLLKPSVQILPRHFSVVTSVLLVPFIVVLV